MTRSIYFIDETAQIGGAEINLLTSIEPLVARGWTPCVILPQSGPFSARLEETDAAVTYVRRPPFISTTLLVRHRYKIPNPFALLFSILAGILWTMRLYRFLRRQEATVVQTISMWSHAFGGLAARLAGHTVVWHFQDIVAPRAGWGLYHQLVLLAARFIPHHIICISNRVAAPFQTRSHLQHKVTVLWNTVDVGRFATNGTKPRNSDLAHLKIGTVARLTPWKGQEVALQAARQLKQRGVSFHWTFAGDESLGAPGFRRSLISLVKKWQLDDHIHFTGWLEDIDSFYHTLDVLVHLPVEPEPFGLVLAEAMAAGVPVIAASGGGADDFIVAGGGALVPPSDPAAVADTLDNWHREESLASRSRTARSFALATFGLDTYLDRLTALYATLIRD